jgi:hypothetical protein
MAYTYTNTKGVEYHLNSKQIQLKNGKTSVIYYFSRDLRPDTSCDLPDGKEVYQTARTGMPVLKNIK